MASVAICPHCYLQLAVPGGTASDARVECPTCHEEFDLPQAVLRPIPEVLPVERSAASAKMVAEFDEQAIHDELENELPAGAADAEVEAKTQAAEEEASPPALQPRSATLAELMLERDAQDDEPVPGPSFDLPNVPLMRENGGTVEFESMAEFGTAGNTEFELDDVDFETAPPRSHAADFNEPFSNEPEFAPTAAADMPTFEKSNFPEASVVAGPPPRRRRRSPLRTLVGAVLGGFLGLAVGYYLLMYLLGPRGDFLQVAKYIPSALLPSSFAHAAPPLVESRAPVRMPEQPELPTTLPSTEDSANIPAGYVESAAELPADESAATESDRYEPSEFDDAPAEPLATEPLETLPPETAPPVASAAPLPIEGPTYTASEMEAALVAAEQAQPGLVSGDLSDAAVRRTKGLSYAKLCDLAHALVFAKLSADVPSDVELQSRATKLFQETLAAPHTRDEVARIAAIWIDSPHRRHGGVFVAGTLSGGQIAGDVYEYQLEIEDGVTFAVLSSQPIDTADGTDGPLAVVGTIVDRPADEVAGYTGTAERAIWAAHALPLE